MLPGGFVVFTLIAGRSEVPAARIGRVVDVQHRRCAVSRVLNAVVPLLPVVSPVRRSCPSSGPAREVGRRTGEVGAGRPHAIAVVRKPRGAGRAGRFGRLPIEYCQVPFESSTPSTAMLEPRRTTSVIDAISDATVARCPAGVFDHRRQSGAAEGPTRASLTALIVIVAVSLGLPNAADPPVVEASPVVAGRAWFRSQARSVRPPIR